MDILVLPSGKHISLSFIKDKFISRGVKVEYKGKSLFRLSDGEYYTFIEIPTIDKIDCVVGYILRAFENASKAENYINSLNIKNLIRKR